jgi:hypothetical protein
VERVEDSPYDRGEERLCRAPSLPRHHLGEAVRKGGDELTEKIADAPAPFWRHVREAMAERHP